MKTKSIISVVILLLYFQQVIQSQTLTNQIKQSIIEIGKTFPNIPKERLLLLDQIAFSVFKNVEAKSKINILFIDKNNHEFSQLAMIWLQTSLLYYGHSEMFNIKSAGITADMRPMAGLASLNDYGYLVRNIRGKNSGYYKVKFGSNSWVVYPKSLQSLNPNGEHVFKIYLESEIVDKVDINGIELLFFDQKSIPREMLYMATRLNNLFETNQ